MPTKTNAIKTAAPVIEEPVATVEKIEPKKIAKKFEANDMIQVRSITQGELLLPGKKSGLLYRWSAYGDITEVEYQDLYALKSSRSQYIYSPLFIIEDEDLLEDVRWKDVKALYESMYENEDLDAILRLSLASFKKTLKSLPTGMQNAVKIEIATRIDNGTFDSIQKIKAVDEIFGTDFITLIS